MTFWELTSIGLAWLLTRSANSATMPEWMATTCSNALDSLKTRLMTSSVGTGRLGVKWSRSQARALDEEINKFSDMISMPQKSHNNDI
ncbi:hypothetical protein TNCV_1791231 [Trichonephila clavipes]|nr:hypothetical protein TNCV_1791231 [Trichonephila clavipes]